MNKNIITWLVIIAALISGYYLFFQKETWQGFYYPDGCLVCEDQYIYSPVLENRASCLAWASDLKQRRGNPDDTFECGKNCKAPDHQGGLYVCDETIDY